MKWRHHQISSRLGACFGVWLLACVMAGDAMLQDLNSGDSTEDMSVSTGQYVTDDVYVGVVQGSKPQNREVVTEITLTPAISGKTAIDSAGNQSVGVEWKHDY